MTAFTLRSSFLRGDLLRGAVNPAITPAASITPGTSSANGTFINTTRGDTKLYTVILSGLDSTGITGWQFWLTAKHKYSDADSAAIFQKIIGNGISIEDTGSTGSTPTILIEINQEDTAGLANIGNLYPFDLQAQDAGGNRYTLISGYLEITPEVTQA